MSACGLRQGAVNAGGSQAGISGWGAYGSSILYFFVASPFTSNARALGVFQRQFKFPRQRIDRRPGLLPDTLALESHVTDATSPWRNHATDGSEIAAIGVLLIEPPHDVGRDPDECTK